MKKTKEFKKLEKKVISDLTSLKMEKSTITLIIIMIYRGYQIGVIEELEKQLK